MTRNSLGLGKLGLGVVMMSVCLLAQARDARADDATVSVGQRDRFAEPPEENPPSRPIVVDDPTRFGPDQRPELHRSPFRLQLGPQGVSTGKGFGIGVGLAADFGSGSVGGRLAASWLLERPRRSRPSHDKSR